MHLYGLIIGLCFLFLLFKIKNTSTFFQFGLGLSCLIGARLYHVFDYWDYYSTKPIEIFYTWNGGLGIFGAILGGFLFIILYSHILNTKYHIPNTRYYILDSITPWLPLVQSIGRLGNFINREIPNWWAESLANLLLFVFIQKYPSSPTAKYLLGYGLIRFFFEFSRTDTWTIGPIKIGQLISIVFIISGLLIFLWPAKTHLKTPSKSSFG